MKIFVTGGDGLLGSNLVRTLIDRGHELRVLVQPERKVNTLEGLDLEEIEGDLLDFDSLKAAAGKAEAIFHLAASTKIWPVKCPSISQVNIEGTKNILKLASEIKIKRFIHVGTATSFGNGTKNEPGHEGNAYKGYKYGLDYLDTKYQAHQMVSKAIQNGIPGIIVNPTYLLGAYDSTPSSGKMILGFYKKKPFYYAPGGKNCINAKDAAIGIANALDKGKIGESYIIGNENLSYKELFEKIALVLGYKAPHINLPVWILLGSGYLLSQVSAITKKEPVISYTTAKIASEGHFYSSEKAVKELDLPQTPIEEGILECFEWFKNNGYLN